MYYVYVRVQASSLVTLNFMCWQLPCDADLVGCAIMSHTGLGDMASTMWWWVGHMGSVHVFNFSICYHIAHNDFHLWHLQWPVSIRNKQSDVLLWEAVIGHACDGEREKTFDHGALCVHRGSVCMS